jgi:hypothetical protein
VSTLVPPLFVGLVDDASVLPPSMLGVAEAVAGFRRHEQAWYRDLLGALLMPSSLAGFAPGAVGSLPISLISDVGISALPARVAKLRAEGAAVPQIEAAVARRGEDPQPGLAALRQLSADHQDLEVYAEIPLSWGLQAALDTVAEARAGGQRLAPKFRVGGLAAELFPTPVELAAVICACRDRQLPFKFTAGLRHALRHTDPETGFTHHGFLNVLVAVGDAAEGGEVADVAESLAATHPVPLVEPARARRDSPRPLWVGFGSPSVIEPLTELVRLGLINGGFE